MFPKCSFTKETPFNIILEGKFIGRSFTSISGDRFTKTLFVTFRTDAITLDFKFAFNIFNVEVTFFLEGF